MTTVQSIYEYLDTLAPFASQPSHDNSGILVGDAKAEVTNVLVCLDATNAVIKEAADKFTDLIISHHPLMYRAVKQVLVGEPVYELISNDIALIAAHNNLDIAVGGLSDLMVAELNLPHSSTALDHEGYGRIVELGEPIAPKTLAEKTKTAFDCTVVRYTDGGKQIKKLAVCAGGGGDLVETAIAAGCDAYICGDLRHQHMIHAANAGLTLIDAGHFHTENLLCEDLVAKLRAKFPKLSIEKAKNSKDVCNYVS